MVPSASRRSVPAACAVVLAAVLATHCAGKASPTLSPEGRQQLIELQVVTALTDTQDGVIAANAQAWLSDEDTRIIVTGIQVALVTIEAAPGGARAMALAALDRIQAGIPAGDLPKVRPYLDSARAMVTGIQ